MPSRRISFECDASSLSARRAASGFSATSGYRRIVIRTDYGNPISNRTRRPGPVEDKACRRDFSHRLTEWDLREMGRKRTRVRPDEQRAPCRLQWWSVSVTDRGQVIEPYSARRPKASSLHLPNRYSPRIDLAPSLRSGGARRTHAALLARSSSAGTKGSWVGHGDTT